MQEFQKLDNALNGKMKQMISPSRLAVQWKPQWEEIIGDVPKLSTGCPRVQKRTKNNNYSPTVNTRF